MKTYLVTITADTSCPGYNKVLNIKVMRAATRAGLRESKELIDLAETRPIKILLRADQLGMLVAETKYIECEPSQGLRILSVEAFDRIFYDFSTNN